MSEEITQGSSKAKYVVIALAAVFFLFVRPGVVLPIASDMTGVELTVRGGRPVPEYQVINRRRVGTDIVLWLRVPEATPEEDMNIIIRHIVNTRYTDRTRLTFYVFDSVDPETKRPKRPSWNEADHTFEWGLTSGIQRVE